ncbi:MAG: hypothetical protein QF893_22765 [Alphaproteobacteria bacterium]|jgi:hypothetical protein|nr:hypothetical protein [Alphaproteobacteria bacterium]
MLRRLLIVLVLSSAMLWAPAVSAAAPADAMIRSAVADLKRYEAQTARLTPARKASAKRILKLLEITAGRLGKSRNKDHPSWKAADERLVALREDLRRLVGEKNETKPGNKQAQVLAQQIERALGRARFRMSSKLALAVIDIAQVRRGLDRLKALDPEHRSIADFERRYKSLAPAIAKKALAWARTSFAKQRAEIDRVRAAGNQR